MYASFGKGNYSKIFHIANKDTDSKSVFNMSSGTGENSNERLRMLVPFD